MGTEEHRSNDPLPPNHAQPPSPAPAVATGTPPVALPQYPELIMNAIEALNDENGSNKSAISKHIEDTYGTLPPAHTTLLSHHLNKMKATGQLLFVKNNYKKPDPDAPPRRGRGRPPKPKSPLPLGTVLSPPRPRGRPPKSRDPNDPPPPPKPKAAPSQTASGKKRGRPPKVTKTVVPAPSASVGAASGIPRGRGRPPKVKPAVAATVGA